MDQLGPDLANKDRKIDAQYSEARQASAAWYGAVHGPCSNRLS